MKTDDAAAMPEANDYEALCDRARDFMDASRRPLPSQVLADFSRQENARLTSALEELIQVADEAKYWMQTHVKVNDHSGNIHFAVQELSKQIQTAIENAKAAIGSGENERRK